MSKIIYVENDQIILRYEPYNGVHFIVEKFAHDENITIGEVLTLEKTNLLYELNNEDNCAEFIIGYRTNEFLVIKKEIIGTKYNVIFDNKINLDSKLLALDFNFNIFKYLENVIDANQIKILVNDMSDAIPFDVFKILIDKFPNQYEINRYKQKRVQIILNDFVRLKKDYIKKYNDYINKKNYIADYTFLEIVDYAKNEFLKYSKILKELNEMLLNDCISEKEWQDKILSIILFLYPKYITYIKEFSFDDVINNTVRRIDIALIDDSGNIDIVEIKKPNDFHLLNRHKYRDNYHPSNDLSGSIMQAEKYIYYLSQLGKNKIDKLPKNEKDKIKLEKLGLHIKITSPKVYIVAGRTSDYSDDELLDLELIKRKYKNVIDIISYDDLINRLEKLIDIFSDESLKD